jgi:predicted permease
MTGSLALRQSRYPEAPARLAVFEAILGRLVPAPGTEAVALASMWPLQQAALQPVRAGEGRETRAAGQLVSPAYFDTLSIPLRAGRAFGVHDRTGTEPVVIVSETLARRLWDDENAVGRYVEGPPPHSSEPEIRRRIVGVVADVRQGPLDDDLADVYVPLFQEPGRFAFAFIRSSTPPDRTLATLRETIRQVDPEIAIVRSSPMSDLADQAVAGSRLLAGLLAGFAAAAAALSLVGVYGAVAYAVRQRERELAVRVAIGADPSRIVRLMVRQSAVVLAAGITLGLAGALVVGRLLESQLFGVAPADPMALAGMAFAFGAAALAATWWPARRAARTDPAIALRAE